MRQRRVLKIDSGSPPGAVGGTPAVAGAPRLQLTLFGRVECHLCEDAAAVLDALAGDLEISVNRVDIDGLPAVRTRYDRHVPVLCHEDTEICRHSLDLPKLERYLASQRDAASR